MNIGIYNPYHDTLGGGEQYVFSFAAYLLKHNHSVFYYSSNPSEKKHAEDRFGVDLSKLQIGPALNNKSIFQKINTTRTLDLFLFYSDGSIPFSLAKQTYLLFQFPVPWVSVTSITSKIKLRNITGFLANSNFTKQFVDKTYSVNSKVIYPAIHTSEYVVKKKAKIILSVGRFTKGMNTKRQDILIEAFKKLIDGGMNEWKLILAGGVLNSDWDEVDRLKKQAQGYPITFECNVKRDILLSYYGTAMCYWHAAGFNVDEQKHPEQVEHFGISTVEAMASGAIPFVYAAGGQKEIVEQNKNGFWWNSIDELIEKTRSVLSNEKKADLFSSAALIRAQDFDIKCFYKRLDTIF